MKIDLFATACFDIETGNFGIEDKQPATVVSFGDGIANVENPYSRKIYFVPLDKNIVCYKTNGKDEESQCDALLICIRPVKKYDFYFVELKNMNKNWIADGTTQLKTTVLNFKAGYNLTCISKKSAFLANKSHPSYHSKHTELMEKFRNETGFRLVICATISIK
jgi:hypothetical protein